MRMNMDYAGKLYVAAMSIYFLVSGFNAFFDIEAKLARIGLVAVDADGKIAFILIYCSLMVGIGVAIAVLYFVSKTWRNSAILATIIITSFIVFRFLGSFIVGELSHTQVSFIAIELIEVSIGVYLLSHSSNFRLNTV